MRQPDYGSPKLRAHERDELAHPPLPEQFHAFCECPALPTFRRSLRFNHERIDCAEPADFAANRLQSQRRGITEMAANRQPNNSNRPARHLGRNVAG